MRPWRFHTDGQDVLAVEAAPAEQLVILRTGPGEKRVLKGEGLVYTSATWIPGSTRILVGGYKPGVPPALYVQDIAGGDPRPVVTGTDRGVVSPDGSTVATIDPQGEVTLMPVAGGSSRAVHGLPPSTELLRWEKSGRKIFARAGTVPFKILPQYRDGTRGSPADIRPIRPVGGGRHSGDCYSARRSIVLLFIYPHPIHALRCQRFEMIAPSGGVLFHALGACNKPLTGTNVYSPPRRIPRFARSVGEY